MSIKINRAIAKSIVHDLRITQKEIINAIPLSVIKALSSSQLAELIDAMYANYKRVVRQAEEDIINEGAVFDHKKGRLIELQATAL